MRVQNITKDRNKVYLIVFVLTALTFFATGMFEDKIRIVIAFGFAIVYVMIGLYILYRQKLILKIYNGIFDKDIKYFLMYGSQRIDSLRFSGYYDFNEQEIKSELKDMLKNNMNILNKYQTLNLIGTTDGGVVLIRNMINDIQSEGLMGCVPKFGDNGN